MDDEPPIEKTQYPDNTEKPSSTPPSATTPKLLHIIPLRFLALFRKKNKKASPVRIALTIFLCFLVLVGGACTASYIFYYKNIQQPVAQFIRPVSRSSIEPQLNTTPSYDAISGRSWNLLLLGSDNDQKYSFPALLTQVIMIVHVDTVNQSVQMVSIPRDSWVSVPAIGGMHKIDQAFFLGAIQRNNFEDGVRIARQTVEKDYGISIDRYGWIGLSGFAKVIDTLGGVDIDITHPLIDESYPDDTGKSSDPNNPYAYQRLYIAPGLQHLNGTQALEYVRSRHSDLIGDIGRTQRQQQVLQALKQKLNTASILTHLSTLMKDLNGQVYTDLNEQEMLAFANFGRVLDSKNIARITLGPGSGSQNFGTYASVYDPSTNSNQDVILPDCTNIQPVLSNIFQLGIFSGGCNVTTTG